jgi:hypothetical protein
MAGGEAPARNDSGVLEDQITIDRERRPTKTGEAGADRFPVWLDAEPSLVARHPRGASERAYLQIAASWMHPPC